MLRITTDQKRGKTILSVEGRLAGTWVKALEECWRELRMASPRGKFQIDLCGVSYIDNGGKLLLTEIHRQGGKLLAEGCLNQAIIEEIVEAAEAGKHVRRREARSKSGPIVFWLFLASLLGPAFTAHAQEKPAEGTAPTPIKLTLDQAVALALKQNPQVQIGVLQAAQSEQDRLMARAALLPQAQLQVSDSARRQNIETGIGFRIPGASQHTGPFQVFSAGPSFGMPIFDLTLWRRWQAARENESASRAQSESTREQVVLLVVSQYLGCLRAGADVKAAESRVALAQALYDQAADLQKEGVGTSIDTLRANVELQNEKQRLIQSRTSQQTSIYGLSRVLNLDPRQPVEIADELSFFETPSFSTDESLNKAFAARPELKALDAQIRSAERSKQAARASRLPALSVDGNWAYSGISSTTGIPTYNYQVSARMPLFTGGGIHAEIVRADLEIQKIEQQRAEVRNQVALDVKTALLNLESTRNEVQVANLGVKLAEEEVSQARDRFQAGVANNIEVISAQDSLARANDNQIAALYRFNQARADLARALGEIEKLYAK
jgi:outer membrane protein TolC/ABC-type transporter Mla MlaB component